MLLLVGMARPTNIIQTFNQEKKVLMEFQIRVGDLIVIFIDICLLFSLGQS